MAENEVKQSLASASSRKAGFSTGEIIAGAIAGAAAGFATGYTGKDFLSGVTQTQGQALAHRRQRVSALGKLSGLVNEGGTAAEETVAKFLGNPDDMAAALESQDAESLNELSKLLVSDRARKAETDEDIAASGLRVAEEAKGAEVDVSDLDLKTKAGIQAAIGRIEGAERSARLAKVKQGEVATQLTQDFEAAIANPIEGKQVAEAAIQKWGTNEAVVGDPVLMSQYKALVNNYNLALEGARGQQTIQLAASGDPKAVADIDLADPGEWTKAWKAGLGQLVGPDSRFAQTFDLWRDAQQEGAPLPEGLAGLIPEDGTAADAFRNNPGLYNAIAGTNPDQAKIARGEAVVRQTLPDTQRALSQQFKVLGSSVGEGDLVVNTDQRGVASVALTPDAQERLASEMSATIAGLSSQADLNAQLGIIESLGNPGGVDITAIKAQLISQANAGLKSIAKGYEQGVSPRVLAAPQVNIEQTVDNIAEFNAFVEDIDLKDVQWGRRLDEINPRVLERRGPRRVKEARENAKLEHAPYLIPETFVPSVAAVGWATGDTAEIENSLFEVQATRAEAEQNPFTDSKVKAGLQSREQNLVQLRGQINADRAAQDNLRKILVPWANQGGSVNIPESLSGLFQNAGYRGEQSVLGIELFQEEMTRTKDDSVESLRNVIRFFSANKVPLSATGAVEQGAKTEFLESMVKLEDSWEAKTDAFLEPAELLMQNYSAEQALKMLDVPVVNGRLQIIDGSGETYIFKVKDMAAEEVAAYAAFVHLTK